MVAVALVHPTPAPAPRAQAGWWRYIERSHTHEVLAQWRSDDGRFDLRETSAPFPEARIEERFAIERPWEARVALWQLEARLSQLGSYWSQRSTDGAWRKLATPAGAPRADPRRNLVLDPTHAPIVHHYHDEHGGGDHLLAALRAPSARYVIVNASLDVPSLDIGRIDLLHGKLPDPLMQSIILREQLRMAQAAVSKLVTRDDYQRAFGHGGERRAARLVDEVIDRVRANQFERPEARLEESDVYAEFLVTLQDPRLRALHARFLRDGEEAQILAGGAPAIRKAIAQKRAGASHATKHLLTILEASLLARERMASGQLARSDPEVRALTRVAYYL